VNNGKYGDRGIETYYQFYMLKVLKIQTEMDSRRAFEVVQTNILKGLQEVK
jgi:hypothetical protein